MGALLKLGVIPVVLALSYVFTSIIIGSASVLSARLSLAPTSSTSYSIFAGDFLFLATAVTVSAFFTIPGILAVFGHGGAWVKRVLARSGKGLLALLGVSFVLFVGAEAASMVQTAPVFASLTSALPILAVVGLLALAILSGDAFLKLTAVVLESIFQAARGLSSVARKQSVQANKTLSILRRRMRRLQEAKLQFPLRDLRILERRRIVLRRSDGSSLEPRAT